jgi:hypothetical protein
LLDQKPRDARLLNRKGSPLGLTLEVITPYNLWFYYLIIFFVCFRNWTIVVFWMVEE